MAFGKITAGIKYIREIIGAIPAITKVRKGMRVTGILGMIVDLVMALMKSASTLNIKFIAVELGLQMVKLNQGILDNIAALKAGATGIESFFLTWGIFGRVWFILFLTGILAAYIRQVHVGDNAPKWQLMVLSFGILTMFNMLGIVMVDVIEQGAFYGDFGTPWGGLVSMANNIQVWMNPTVEAINSIPGVSVEKLGEVASNKTVNGTNGSITFS